MFASWGCFLAIEEFREEMALDIDRELTISRFFCCSSAIFCLFIARSWSVFCFWSLICSEMFRLRFFSLIFAVIFDCSDSRYLILLVNVPIRLTISTFSEISRCSIARFSFSGSGFGFAIRFLSNFGGWFSGFELRIRGFRSLGSLRELRIFEFFKQSSDEFKCFL